MTPAQKILLVDDDSDDQFFFRNAVREIDESLDCVIVDNGKKAIEYLENNTNLPILIFLDLNMPLMNGFECLAVLKKNSVFKEIPITIFSTSRTENDRNRSLALGADNFISKTDDFRDFKKNIREILQHSL